MHTYAVQRFDNFNPHRPDNEVQPVAQHVLGSAQIILLAVDQQAETCIHNVQLRINTQGSGEKHRAVRRVSVKKEAVVKIAFAGSQRHRLRRLMQRIIVGRCEHDDFTWPRCRRRF